MVTSTKPAFSAGISCLALESRAQEVAIAPDQSTPAHRAEIVERYAKSAGTMLSPRAESRLYRW
jgi:hypothetical protein